MYTDSQRLTLLQQVLTQEEIELLNNKNPILRKRAKYLIELKLNKIKGIA
jgi:hypothetical protein